MKVVKVRLNNKGRIQNIEHANCLFYIPYKEFVNKSYPLCVNGGIGGEEYLTVCDVFTIPDNAILRIKNFYTLAKDYPHSNHTVLCQCSFTREMNGDIAWDKIRLSDLINNGWWYKSYRISLDMLEINSFIDKFKRI